MSAVAPGGSVGGWLVRPGSASEHARRPWEAAALSTAAVAFCFVFSINREEMEAMFYHDTYFFIFSAMNHPFRLFALRSRTEQLGEDETLANYLPTFVTRGRRRDGSRGRTRNTRREICRWSWGCSIYRCLSKFSKPFP